MTTLWRISNYLDLSGRGAFGTSGRWHTEGRAVVYLADNPAGAMLERIVHLMDRNEDGILPRYYQLLQIPIPDGVAVKQLSPLAPADWKEHVEYTRQIGDAWLAGRETALARVPSAIIPRTWNYLLNPKHPDATQIEVTEVIKERFDNRLFRFGGC
jgi:RES domain-containing protein